MLRYYATMADFAETWIPRMQDWPLAAGTRPFDGAIASVNGKLHQDDQSVQSEL
jgi:hypothetical protein